MTGVNRVIQGVVTPPETLESAVEWAVRAAYLVVLVSAPPVLAALVVGLAVSVVQALTRIQEPTVAFVPRAAAAAVAAALLAPWMARRVMTFAGELWRQLPGLGG